MPPEAVLTDTEERLFQLAKRYLAARDNETHTRITINFAFSLLGFEHGDRTVVMPAIILHDTGWSRVPEEMWLRSYGPKADETLTRIHEREGAKIAEAILNAVGYDPAKTASIVRIIDGHDTRSSSLSPDDEIVKDADKLFRFSRVGFAARAKDYGMTARQNYARLKRHLDEWLFLPASKLIAQKELAERLTEMGKA